MNIVPLACIPAAIAPDSREAHFALLRRLFRGELTKRTEVENGCAYQFAASAFDDLARFVSNERKCCPFLDFRLDVTPAQGPLTLTVTGPSGTIQFLRAEFEG